MVINIFSRDRDIAKGADGGLEKARNLLLKTGGNGTLAVYVMTESLAEWCPEVTWKAELLSDGLGHQLRRFPSQVLKIQPVYFWLLTAKCVRSVIT